MSKMQVPRRRNRARSRQALSGGSGKSVIADSCEVLLPPPSSRGDPFDGKLPKLLKTLEQAENQRKRRKKR